MRIAIAIAWLVGCGSASPPIEIARDRALRPEHALARVIASHPDGVVYAIDLTRSTTKAGLSAWLLEDDRVRGIHVDLHDGTIAEETRAIAENVREPARALSSEIRARGTPMSTGLSYMLDRYGVERVSAVELEMHGVSLVLEAVVTDGDGASTYVHDPDDGHYLMTEGS